MKKIISNTDRNIEKQINGETFSFNNDDMELLNTLSKKISDSCKQIDKECLGISIALYTIDYKKLYLIKDAKNISLFADRAYNIKHSQTYNYINVVKKFGDIQPDGSCSAIKKEFEKFTISKLIRMLNVPDDKLCMFKPEMTVKEIETIAKETTAAGQPSEKEKTYVEDELTTPKVIYEIKSQKSLDGLSDVINDIKKRIMAAPGRNKYYFKIVQEPARRISTRVERKSHEN